MPGCGGREFGEAIGAGRGDGQLRLANQLERDGVRGNTQADSGQAGGDDIGDERPFWQHEGQGTGPESARELLCGIGPGRGEGLCHFDRVDMNDERAVGGTALGGEDFLDCGGVEGVGAETVDSFGGEGDEFAGAEESCGLRDLGGRHLKDGGGGKGKRKRKGKSKRKS